MLKKKGLGKRIAGIVLAAAMVITLLPPVELVASGVEVNGYPIYNDVIFDAIKSDKITNTSAPSTSTVYGGITSWFYLDKTSLTDATDVGHNNSYTSTTRVNLGPAMDVESYIKNQSWKAEYVFQGQQSSYITGNTDVSLKFGATLKSTKSGKPSFTLGSATIGGSSLSKNKTAAVEGTLSSPSSSLKAIVQGAYGTKTSGMWVAAIDNSPAEYAGISAWMDGSRLYVSIQMDEELRWANSTADQYKDQMYIVLYAKNSLTNTENISLKAEFDSLKGNSLVFCCSDLKDDLANGEFQITRIHEVNIPVEDMNFAVYGVRSCYDYRYSYSPTKGATYTTIGNKIAYLQDVTLYTTPITDLAGNKVDLSAMSLINKNLCFDQLKPSIDAIRIEDANGMNRDDASKITGSEESGWPEDISREELFLGNAQGINFSVVTTELVTLKTNSVTAKLNVLDANGKQITLQAIAIEEEAPGIYEERTKSVIRFETFTATTGMSMMSDYEGKPIQIVGITGDIKDKGGNGLTSTIPTPEKRIFLDADAPTVTVEKTVKSEEGRDLELQVTVNDRTKDVAAAGILGEYATLNLTPNKVADKNYTYNYSYKVLTTDNKELTSGTGSMSADKAGVIRWKLHANDSYAAKVQIHIENGENITIDGIQTSVSVEDIVGNRNTGTDTSLDYLVDEVAPVLTIQPVKYTYGDTTADVSVDFKATDYSELAFVQYQWTDITATQPDSNAWTALETEAGTASVEKTITKTVEKTASYKLWIQVGDSKGNTSIASTEVEVILEKPSIYYDDSQITTEPDYAPQLTVIGPAARAEDNLEANTRVTVTMGDNVYVRIVKTGETVNVFDFDGTWYKVVFNADKSEYTSVTTLSDNSALKNYYGEVTVSFDAAYADLTPATGSISQKVTNASYVSDTAAIKVLYASTTVKEDPKEVHKVTFGEVKDPVGTEVLAEDGTKGNATVLLNQIAGETSVIAGTQFTFTLSNEVIEDWGITNIDFGKSYVELVYTKGDVETVIDKELLQNTASQTYTLPASLDYETGMYFIKVYVYQSGSDAAAEYQSLNLVLDAQTVQNAGLWEYTIYPYENWADREIVHTGDTAPLEMVGISVGDETLIQRDNVFAYYTAGASRVDISLQCLENVETYDEITVGEVVGFRMWNSLSNMTETDLEGYAFTRNEDATAEGRAEQLYNLFRPKVYETDSFPQGSEGFIDPADVYLPVVKGINTFYYQVMLSNGTVSEVRSFTLVVSDITPSLNLSVDSIEKCLRPSTVENQTSVKNITMKVEDASSMNGSGEVIISLLTSGNVDVTRDDNTENYKPSDVENFQLQVGDLVLFDEDGDNSKSEETYRTNFNDARVGFIVYDEFGGAMVVAPQMGYEGDEDYETCKYSIDDTEWKIAPFNTTTAYTDWYRDQETDEKVANSCFVKCGLVFIDNDVYSTELYLPEYVDYDSISITFFNEAKDENGNIITDENGDSIEVDYLTVPLVENYTEPNPAGYMGAEIMPYSADNPYGGQIIFYIANPVDVESPGYTRYKVNYKDINGNDYVRYGGYTPMTVSSAVSSVEMTESGAVLYVGAAVEGGIDAQYVSGSVSRGIIKTGVFANGTHSVTYTDMFGTEHTIEYEITNGWDFGVDVSYSTLEPTLNDVTVTLNSTQGIPITVAEADGITVESNGTSTVVVTASKNVTFDFTTTNSDEVHSVAVDNIVEFEPTIQWSYDESQILTDENGTEYLYGPVTAYIIDEELDVIDCYTGLEPSYTFYPGEETSYTFKGSDYYAVLGSETVEGSDLTVKLPVELRNETFEVEDPDLPAEDTDAPAVQLRAYAQRNGVFENENLALQVEPGMYYQALTDYKDDKITECLENRADTTEFLRKIGWASVYRFQIELLDDSDVKLFVKRGLYANAPNYAIGGSDTIDGVSLNGRVLEITDTVEFTLFAVDENGNATAIPFNVTNVGKAPVPQVKTIYAGTTAYVYVLPPEVSNPSDVTDFKLTAAPDATGMTTEKEADSEYSGQWYAAFTKNGTYSINYSYTYKGEPVIGVLEVVVDEIDDVQILSEGTKWSGNKSSVSTNQDVTAQITFNKNVETVYVPSGMEDKVDVLITGNRVTVRYAENLDELPLTAVAYNGTNITLILDAVTNIDKVAPEVTGTDITLAKNGKSVTVTFTTDEDALFREGNSYGTETDDGYVHTKKITKNGTYTYSFMDKSGNIKQVTFTVDTIVDTELKLWFNTSASDTGAVEDPSKFTLKVGGSIYVKANRKASISLNNGTAKEVTANTWQAFEITDNEAGLWPIIYAVDDYGNTNAALLSGVKPLDKDAPVITIIKDCVYAKVETERADILTLLKANITVTDADTDVDVTIDFTDDMTVEGTTTVTYTAKDSSGNVATKTGWLRLTSVGEPEVKVDGEAVGRDSVYLGSLDDDLKLSVDTSGEPYSIVFKKGVFTTAQMKIGATVLLQDAETVTNTELPFTEAGYYTVCIRTQSHDEYLFIVYVE